MLKTLFIFLLIIAGIALAIPMIPLKTAVQAMHLDKFGVAVRDVDGNLWAGHLYEVQFGKITLGDVSTKLSLADLSKGRVKLEFAGTDEIVQPKGAFSYGMGGLGLEKLSMAVPGIGGAPMIPPATLVLDELTAFFPGEECADVTGGSHIYLAGTTAGSGLPQGMSGPAVCRDGHLTFDMASDDGNFLQEVSILSTKSYRVRATIKHPPLLLSNKLRTSGFVANSDGYVYEVEKTL
jgi:general secretion pathway protein N